MQINKLAVNLLSKKLSDYNIGSKWASVNFELEKYLLEKGYHSINEVPHGDEPLDDKTLQEEFVWLPQSEGNARIIVLLPHSNNKTKIFEVVKSRLVLVYQREIVGVGQFRGMDETYEYYQFNFGPDLVQPGTKLFYDNKEVEIKEPSKRLGNGIKERFLAEGGAGLGISGGGGGSSEPGNPLPGAPLGFLWKPYSDSDGNLVVLVPEGSNSFCFAGATQGNYAYQANGDRAHYRFSQPGASFPNGVLCKTGLGTFAIPFPALRWEGIN